MWEGSVPFGCDPSTLQPRVYGVDMAVGPDRTVYWWGIWETIGRGMVAPKFTKEVMEAQMAALNGELAHRALWESLRPCGHYVEDDSGGLRSISAPMGSFCGIVTRPLP